MRTDKVLQRLAQLGDRPELLEWVARDVGVALARGDRDALRAMVRELAARAPGAGEGAQPGGEGAQPGLSYWAGFAAGMGVLLAAYEAEHEHDDAREAALRVAGSGAARSVLRELAAGPCTGAELAARLRLTPGGVSRVLKTLRTAGLARVLGGGGAERTPLPERGAPKPHALTPLGVRIADELLAGDAEPVARHVAAR